VESGTLGDECLEQELRSRLQSLERHCLRDLEENLEALVHETEGLTSAQVPYEIVADDGAVPLPPANGRHGSGDGVVQLK
jgi:hypothetical protein